MSENTYDKTSKNAKQRLFVDIDGTLAVFKPVDTLETLYEEGYFLNLSPHENVVDAVQKIIKENDDIEVFIMSAVLSDSKYALAEKNEWIDKYLPKIDEAHRIFPPCGEDKKDYIPGGVRDNDFLLDDYTHNLTLWQPPARGIKLLNGINHTNGTWQYDRLDYRKTGEVLADNVVSIMKNEEVIKDISPRKENTVDRGNYYAILQWGEGTEKNHEYSFEDLEFLKARGITPSGDDYEIVYLKNMGKEDNPNCEDLYAKFNRAELRPSDYCGHSLSTGDVIIRQSDGESEVFYCNRFGFEKLDNSFITEKVKNNLLYELDIRKEFKYLTNANMTTGLSKEEIDRISYIDENYSRIFEMADKRAVILNNQERLKAIRDFELQGGETFENGITEQDVGSDMIYIKDDIVRYNTSMELEHLVSEIFSKISTHRETPGRNISFLVAESMEFHTLGRTWENIPTIEEAIKIYKNLPEHTKVMGNGISIMIDDLEYELLRFDEINTLEYYPQEIREDETVKEAISALKKEWRIDEMKMPDDTLGIKEMNDYGYSWEEMLPLGKEKALEVFNDNAPLYLLYHDGTETVVEKQKQILEHDGLFGIEKEDWERYSERKVIEEAVVEEVQAEIKAEQLLNSVESREVTRDINDSELVLKTFMGNDRVGVDEYRKQIQTIYEYEISHNAPKRFTKWYDEMNVSVAKEFFSEQDINERYKEIVLITFAEKNLKAADGEWKGMGFEGDVERYEQFLWNIAVPFPDEKFILAKKLATDINKWAYQSNSYPSNEDEFFDAIITDTVDIYNGETANVIDYIEDTELSYEDSLSVEEKTELSQFKERVNAFENKKERDVSMDEEALITENSDNIKVPGHVGTWYVIDKANYNGQDLFLLEHEEYGDETAGLIIDSKGNLILEDVWNGFDDYEEQIKSIEKEIREEKSENMNWKHNYTQQAQEIGKYEEEANVDSSNRVTEWFGDLAVYEIKENVTEEVFKNTYERALEHIKKEKGDNLLTGEEVEKNNMLEADTGKTLDELKNEALYRGVINVMDSSQFKNYCNTMNRLMYNNYSPTNCAKILGQWVYRYCERQGVDITKLSTQEVGAKITEALQSNEAPTYLMGYEGWKKYGRQVSGKNVAYVITAPNFVNEYAGKGSLLKAIKKNFEKQFSENKSLEYATFKLGVTGLSFYGYKNGLIDIVMHDNVIRGKQTEETIRKFLDTEVIGKMPNGYSSFFVYDVKNTVEPEFLWVKGGYTRDELIRDENGNPVTRKPSRTSNVVEYQIRNSEERRSRFNPHLSLDIKELDESKMNTLFATLQAVSNSKGVPMTVEPIEENGTKGFFSHTNNRIVIKDTLSATEKCAVAFHEMAHADMHYQRKDLSREMKEVQAEAVAYMTAQNFGIETSTSSFNYIAVWSKGRDVKELETSMNDILKQSKKLFKEISGELEKQGLDISLEPINKEKDKEAAKGEVTEFIKSYKEFVLTESSHVSEVKVSMKEMLNMTTDERCLNIIKEQASILNKENRKLNGIDKLLNELELNFDPEKAETLMGKVKKEYVKISEMREEFSALSEETFERIQELKKLRKMDIKERYKIEPIDTLKEFINGSDNKSFRELTDKDLDYITKSKYISDNFGRDIKTDMTDFLNKAMAQLENTKQVQAKNGAFVEIAFCERWTEKPIFEHGTVCHPKIANQIIENAEKETRALKKEAEKAGEYFPYSKCHVTLYTECDGKLLATSERVDIGDRYQKNLTDFLKKSCNDTHVLEAYSKAVRENVKDKLAVPHRDGVENGKEQPREEKSTIGMKELKESIKQAGEQTEEKPRQPREKQQEHTK